jgi:linoleoyl-CoA desaturase
MAEGPAATTAPPRVRFPPAGPFYADLKKRVDHHFQRTGGSPRGGWAMRAKTAALLAWLAASYLLLLLGNVSGWQAALLAVSLGLAMAGIGFDVMHDANHGSYSASPRVNRALGFTLDLLGGSSYLWRHKHNLLHHTYTNVSGMDTDVEPGPFLRFTPSQPRHRFHRFQHWYVWLLYGVFPLKWWLFDDFSQLASGRIGGHPYPRPRGRALAGLVGGKALFYGWGFVLPALLHPTWALVPVWLLVSFTLGSVLSTVFQLAHCVGEADFHLAQGAHEMASEWAVHQVTTTVDFARHNRLLGWYLGGLNFQVEHHLFPKVCHVHYPALSAIVEETCRAHGVRYRAQPTLRAALAANVRWLRDLGSAAPLGVVGEAPPPPHRIAQERLDEALLSPSSR